MRNEGQTKKSTRIGTRVMMRMMMVLLGMISKLPMRLEMHQNRRKIKNRKEEMEKHGLLKMEVWG